MTDKGVVRLLKQKPLTVEQKKEMVIMHAKLDLEIAAVFANEFLPAVHGSGEDANAAAANVSGNGGAASDEPELLGGTFSGV